MGKMNALSLVEARVAVVTERFWDADEAEQAVLRAEYRTELQPALLAAYGETGPVEQVDPWMAETYSELYKDRCGFRPSGHSYRYVADWMANIPPLESDEEVDGDRFDPDITKWVLDDEHDAVAEAAREFEDVYGVSGMGQALRFHGILKDY